MPIVAVDGLNVLELGGSPEEMGWEHGRLLKEKLLLGLEGFLRNSEKVFEVPYTFLLDKAKDCVAFIPKDYLSEMRAMAEASGAPYDEILALNCLSDIDALYMKQLHQCCNFVVGPPATVNGFFAHGRNLDFPSANGWVSRSSILIHRMYSAGPVESTWSITWAGFVGTYTGMNSAGVSIAEIGVPANDSSLEGMPMALLIRAALETARSRSETASVFRSSPRTGGYNIAVADFGDKTALCIESTRRKLAIRQMRRGVLIVDDVCFCPSTALNRLTYPAGAFRYARMRQLIDSKAGAIGPDECFQLLRDRFDMARGTDSGRSYNCINNVNTVQSVLFTGSEMYVSHNESPAPDKRYSTIRTDGDA